MNDDDKTPPWTPKAKMQSSDGRALASRKHRAPADGVPIVPAPEDTTTPFDLFAPERRTRRRQAESVAQLADRLREAKPDPYDLIAALGFEVTDSKRETKSQSKELERQLGEFLAIQPGGKRFDRLVSFMRWLAGGVFFAALAIGAWLFARGGLEMKTDMRLQALEKAVDRLVDKADKADHQPRTTP